MVAQNAEVILEDLKPAHDENLFPSIKYSSNTKIEGKLNTFLQLENLEHLPGQFKKHPFEKVAYNEEGHNSSVFFYGYEKINTPKNILSLMLNGEATGAYSEGFEIYYNFDLRTGNKINLDEFLTENGLKEITDKLNLKTKNSIEEYLQSLDESAADEGEEFERIQAQIDMYTYCMADIEENSIDYYEYYFEKDCITFVRGRCSNHAMRAIDDLGRFTIKYGYNEIEEFLSLFGKGILNGAPEIIHQASPNGKFYKGTINNKYKITVLVSEVYSDNSLSVKYWYDKYKNPIDWSGSISDNHFTLKEYDYYDEEKQKWILKARIEADLIDNKIIGTWKNLETNEFFKLNLTEY